MKSNENESQSGGGWYIPVVVLTINDLDIEDKAILSWLVDKCKTDSVSLNKARAAANLGVTRSKFQVRLRKLCRRGYATQSGGLVSVNWNKIGGVSGKGIYLRSDLMQSTEFTLGKRVLLCHLLDRCDKDGEVWLTNDILKNFLGLSGSTIQNAIKDFYEWGLVSKKVYEDPSKEREGRRRRQIWMSERNWKELSGMVNEERDELSEGEEVPEKDAAHGEMGMQRLY